jgi:release factor glutamine methyltransferase
MDDSVLYEKLFDHLNSHLQALPDKPEEDTEGTLRALWWLAAGEPKSVTRARQEELTKLGSDQITHLKALVELRISGVPLAHITKRQQFMGIELIAGPQALVPRNETELLGYAALEKLKQCSSTQQSALVIDVCTGAGNLAVALALSEPRAIVYAADLSIDAVELARQNIAYHGLEQRVEARESDLLSAFDTAKFYNQVDVLTCNPPYISSAKVDAMHKEIADHEPRLAFDGGPFGVSILQRLIQDAPKYLRKGGWLAFEVGLGQGDAFLRRLQKNSCYGEVQSIKDEIGNIRAILACTL